MDALRSGVIAGAGLDVFYDEPNVPAELRALDNVSLLPHIASYAEPTRDAMADLAAKNFVAFLETREAATPVGPSKQATS